MQKGISKWGSFNNILFQSGQKLFQSEVETVISKCVNVYFKVGQKLANYFKVGQNVISN